MPFVIFITKFCPEHEIFYELLPFAIFHTEVCLEHKYKRVVQEALLLIAYSRSFCIVHTSIFCPEHDSKTLTDLYKNETL